MNKESLAKRASSSWRLFALCAALCAPLIGIVPIRDASYRLACHFVPSTQNKIDQQLFMASFNGDLKMVKQSLNRGADIEAFTRSGPSPLCIAIQNHHSEVGLYLVQQGANVKESETLIRFNTPQYNVPLYEAIFYTASPDLIKELISRGANVNWKDRSNVSLLNMATQLRDWPTVELLLRHGANPKLRDTDGKTALGYARREKNSVIIRLLENALRTRN